MTTWATHKLNFVQFWGGHAQNLGELMWNYPNVCSGIVSYMLTMLISFCYSSFIDHTTSNNITETLSVDGISDNNHTCLLTTCTKLNTSETRGVVCVDHINISMVRIYIKTSTIIYITCILALLNMYLLYSYTMYFYNKRYCCVQMLIVY